MRIQDPRHRLHALVITLVILVAPLLSCADADPDPGAASAPTQDKHSDSPSDPQAAALSQGKSSGSPPDPQAAALSQSTYADSLAAVHARRSDLWKQYQGASGPGREDVIVRAQELMRQSVAESVAPFWYGTSWDFNGTSQIPGEGTIECGYFVTTVLRDIGLELERVTLAQQASEAIIKSLVRAEHIKRYSDVPIASFVHSVRG